MGVHGVRVFDVVSSGSLMFIAMFGAIRYHDIIDLQFSSLLFSSLLISSLLFSSLRFSFLASRESQICAHVSLTKITTMPIDYLEDGPPEDCEGHDSMPKIFEVQVNAYVLWMQLLPLESATQTLHACRLGFLRVAL